MWTAMEESSKSCKLLPIGGGFDWNFPVRKFSHLFPFRWTTRRKAGYLVDPFSRLTERSPSKRERKSMYSRTDPPHSLTVFSIPSCFVRKMNMENGVLTEANLSETEIWDKSFVAFVVCGTYFSSTACYESRTKNTLGDFF